jgi:hypothetical protein
MLMLLLVLLAPAGLRANLQAPAGQQPFESQIQRLKAQDTERKRSAFFPKKIAKRLLEKQLKKPGRQNTDKKLSKLARAALYLNIAYLVTSLIAFFGAVVFLVYLGSAALIASLVLCVIVLLDDDQNKMSRNLAKALLIVWGVMFALGLALTLLLILLLASWG